MAWTPAIPQATDFISASQPLILGNFQALDVWSQVDHTAIDSGALNGMHKFTRFPEQINSPDTTAGNIGALVSAQGPISALTELFFIPEGTAPAALAGMRPWTEFRTATLGGNDGYFYVAGGRILVKFNRVNSDGTNPRIYNYVGAPAFLAGSQPVVYAVGFIGGGAGFNVGVIASTDALFQVITYDPAGNLATTNFTYLAIGTPA